MDVFLDFQETSCHFKESTRYHFEGTESPYNPRGLPQSHPAYPGFAYTSISPLFPLDAFKVISEGNPISAPLFAVKVISYPALTSISWVALIVKVLEGQLLIANTLSRSKHPTLTSPPSWILPPSRRISSRSSSPSHTSRSSHTSKTLWPSRSSDRKGRLNIRVSVCALEIDLCCL